MTLKHLNSLSPEEATGVLGRCCGSREWVWQMIAARPFGSPQDLYTKGESLWYSLKKEDWKEAFSHHPKIGDLDSLHERFSATRIWAEGEQAGTSVASKLTLRALAVENVEYEKTFGYIFIVCATGMSADEMLLLLRGRLRNHPDEELRIAAGEQMKITQLRLKKLLRDQQ